MYKGSKIACEVDSPVNINPVVDPSAALTDPMNIDFVPQNDQELQAAIQSQLKSSTLSRDEAYEKIKKALKGDVGDKDMKTNKVEETIRKQIRKVIKEITLNQLPPSLKDIYRAEGAPETGQIPQSVLDKVKSRPEGPRTTAGERKRAALAAMKEPTGDMSNIENVGFGASAADDPTTPMGIRKRKNLKDLQATFSKMRDELGDEPSDVEVEPKKGRDFDVDGFLQKFSNKVNPALMSAVVEHIDMLLESVIDEFNESNVSVEGFESGAPASDLEELLMKFKDFSEHVFSLRLDKSKRSKIADIVDQIRVIKSAILNPIDHVIMDGDSFNSKFKIQDESIRGWVLNAGKELRGSINIPQDYFLQIARVYFENPLVQQEYGITDEQVSDAFSELFAAKAAKPASSLTNETLQSLVLSPFALEYDKQISRLKNYLNVGM